MFRALSENVERNQLSDRVQCLPNGVSQHEGEFELICDDRCVTKHKLVETYHETVQEDQRRRAARVVKVKCVTIDQIVDGLQLDRCDLIKMDIEGAEPGALQGARRTIQRFRPRLSLASYHRPSDTYVLPLMVSEMCPEYNILVTESHLYAFT
jgi:FkbM family methyltransferase